MLLFCGSIFNLSAQDYNLVKKNFDIGNKYLKQGEPNKALAHFQTASLYTQSDIAPLAMAAGACYALELYATAIDLLKDAIEIKDSQAAYSNLGIIYGVLGYDSLSLLAYNKVKSTKHLNKYIAIGAIAERNGDYKKALRNMHLAKDLEKNHIPWYNLGIIHADLNNVDSALYYFDKAIELLPKNYLAYSGKLSVIKDKDNSERECEFLCKKIIKLHPQGSYQLSYLKARGEAYLLLKKEAKMKADFEKCIEKLDHLIMLYPQAYPFITDRAEIHKGLKNYEASIRDYKRSLSINPHYNRTRSGLEKLDNENNKQNK